jgi:plastocyanin
MRRITTVFIVLVAIAAACGDDEPAGQAPPAADTASVSSAPAPTEAPDDTTVDAPVVPALDDYEAVAATLAQPEFDRDLPPTLPESPIGAYGYSRYVYTSANGEIVPSLIEGPLGYQVRCQEEAKDCSYQELKALFESGEPVPGYLGMDRLTLGELVAQLDAVNEAIRQYDDIDDACAAGLWKSTNQIANMGIHMIVNRTAAEFDPSKPQMVLFAKDGGLGLGSREIGSCVNGAWTGEAGYVPVGAVFDLRLTNDHPEGFAGPIDNWHIHYNTCISRSEEAGQLGVDNEDLVGEGGRSATTGAACAAQGGTFLPIISSWMMHAYVADDFEAESGVFSMFNPSVWPVSDPDTLVAERTSQAGDDLESAQILNFSFGDITVDVGETVRFANSDSVPHTVTAGSYLEPSEDFDSGVLGTGQAFDLSFEAPGRYELFCALHPDMTGIVNVE